MHPENAQQAADRSESAELTPVMVERMTNDALKGAPRGP
jgi:hypothetical protein